MRKNYSSTSSAPAASETPQAALATESMDLSTLSIEQILEGRTILSLEEEIVVLQEADQLMSEVADGVAEAERVEDISDAMLNIADTADSITELTPQQAMLIENASEMAVVGTDTNPDNIIPAMEAYIGKNLSAEGFSDDMRARAAAAWERIRKFVLDLWAKITGFFKRMFSVAPRLLANVKALREALVEKKKAGAAAQPKDPAVPVMVGANALSYPGHMVKNAKELSRGLDEMKKLGDWVYGQYLRSVKAQGDLVASELKKYDPNTAADTLKAVASNMPKMNFNTVIKTPGTGYMGCFDLAVVRVEKDKVGQLSDAQVVNALRHTKVQLVVRDGTHSVLHREGFATMTFAEMDTILNNVEALLKQVLAFETSADYKALDKTRQAMIDAATTATGAMSKMSGNDDAGKAQRAFAEDVLKSLQNFTTTFTGWTSNPTAPLVKKITNVARASLVLVDKSLAQY